MDLQGFSKDRIWLLVLVSSHLGFRSGIASAEVFLGPFVSGIECSVSIYACLRFSTVS